jgi:hypothetical protein
VGRKNTCRAQKLIMQQLGKYGVTRPAQVPRRSFDMLAAGETSPHRRMELAVEFLQHDAQGQGEFVSAVDTHIRLTLALGEIEKALSMMRQRVLPRVIRP